MSASISVDDKKGVILHGTGGLFLYKRSKWCTWTTKALHYCVPRGCAQVPQHGSASRSDLKDKLWYNILSYLGSAFPPLATLNLQKQTHSARHPFSGGWRRPVLGATDDSKFPRLFEVRMQTTHTHAGVRFGEAQARQD